MLDTSGKAGQAKVSITLQNHLAQLLPRPTVPALMPRQTSLIPIPPWYSMGRTEPGLIIRQLGAATGVTAWLHPFRWHPIP